MKAIKTGGRKAEKRVMRFAVLFTLFMTFAMSARGQIDPSSAMLLNSSATPARDGGLDTGRYTVRPRDSARLKKPKPTPTPAPVATPAAAPAPATVPSTVPSTVPVSTPKPVTVVIQTTEPKPPAEPTPMPLPQPTSRPLDERRLTLVEISLAPGYLYHESRSTFAPRNYYVNAPTGSIDASVWTSPGLSVHTGFMGTLNANVSDSLDNSRNASVSEQWFSAGLRARAFFGEGVTAPTVTYGLDYREEQFRVPSDTLMRNKLSTNGVFLLVDAEFPTSDFGAWQFGGEFAPRLAHSETSNAYEFRSGSSAGTTAIAAHVGARYRFNHTQSLFWKISYGIEKNKFEGTTSINDPLTGSPQSNVAVTNSFTLFQFGLTWAD